MLTPRIFSFRPSAMTSAIVNWSGTERKLINTVL
jgi:hypothetical protein